jgi:superfamily II DNA or RNA helicase
MTLPVGTTWPDPDEELSQRVSELGSTAIDVYRQNHLLLREHANQEESFRTGGYSERQLFELVQNGADAILHGGGEGRIELRLSGDTLYCANEGAAFTREGLDAVTHAFISDKRADEIGRFGLGFKSVLSVSDSTQVLSRSIAFEFNSERSRVSMRQISSPGESLPVLRVPTSIDPTELFVEDPIASELATWASTIVRMPHVKNPEKIEQQLRTFNTEFLLFAPLVSELRLVIESEHGGFDLRHSRTQLDADTVAISSPDGVSTVWRVLQRMYRPTARARQEVGEAVARSEVKLTFAAPTTTPTSLGRFWSYFPLSDQTTASGIFNAPWRVNDDRTSMITGQYNNEILEEFAQMFVEVLGSFSNDADPARHFEYMPARGREGRGDADDFLSARIPELVAGLALVPDANGTLRQPHDLQWLSRKYKQEYAVMAAWQSSDSAPATFPHPSCYRSDERRARLETLLEGDKGRAEGKKYEIGFAEWLTLLGSSGDLESLRNAVRILRTQRDSEIALLGTEARIIPGGDGGIYKANATKELFFGSREDAVVLNAVLVNEDFAALPDMRADLEFLGFKELSAGLILDALLETASEDWQDDEWDRLWNVVDDVAPDESQRIIASHLRADGLLKMHSEAQTWEPSANLVFPVAGVLQTTDAKIKVDQRYHGSDPRRLRAMGVITGVEAHFSTKGEVLFGEYRPWAIEAFRRQLRRDPSATLSDPTFADDTAPGPLDLLTVLASDLEALTRWSVALLTADARSEWALTQRDGGSFSVPAPHLWAVAHYGLVPTAWGDRSPALSLAPSMLQYSSLLPVASLPQAVKLDLADNLDAIPTVVWTEFLDRQSFESNPQILGNMVAVAFSKVPEQQQISRVPSILGLEPVLRDASDLVIAETAEEALYLRTSASVPFLHIEDEVLADQVIARTGGRRAKDQVTFTELTEGVGESRFAIDRYKGLKRLAGNPVANVQLVECERLAKRVASATGTEDRPVEYLRKGLTLFLQRDLDDLEVIGYINNEFKLGLGGQQIVDVLARSRDSDKDELLERCKLQPDDALRLLMIFSSQELQKRLPKGLFEAIRQTGAPTTAEDVARLFLDVHGLSALAELKHDFNAKGFDAPNEWAGGKDALLFVQSMGFGAAFAREAGRTLSPALEIPGRPGLKPLHGYQENLATQIREVLSSPSGEAEKAMLYLPTGAGKTRVTVEALLRAFLGGVLVGPLLWIAQSDELCEQAVQTWAEVWREFSDTRSLTIGRLWASNVVAEGLADFNVVVATDAQLSLVIENYEYEWLRNASAVIVDEAHVAGDSPRYTRILGAMGVDGRSSERPLIGLTATPFKGDSEERTKRLVNRFGKRRLDAYPDADAYVALQEMGVLARVKHERLVGSTDFKLTESQRELVERTSLLPPEVLEEIGNDVSRTQRVVNHISTLNSDWPVLVFTSSVLSAQVLAALLRTRGIRAASISGTTRMHERRRIIERFKDGEIQVLTNCNVLTQGFDAPGVRALYLAKPTFSPNNYIQMVGRGLRGPLNGGEDECLIVDVVDSFSNFHGELAFTKFDSLWNRSSSPS